jgi:alkylation response protein AidB-like acyl-CoA dehydrogenase
MLGEPTQDQQAFLESVDRFMARHLPPDEVRRRDREHEPPYHLLPLMGEAGLLGVPFPECFGGLDRPFSDAVFIQERLARHGLMAASLFARTVSFGGMTLLSYGTEAMKAQLMPRLLRGELLFAMALSEPGAGSDAAAVQTRARRVEGGWRITGRKTWISDADRADFMVMPCRTGTPDSGKHGLSVFLVPRASDGLSMTTLPKVGHHCMPSWDVGIDDVFVGDEMLMGEIGQGMRHMQSTLQFARATQAASALGQAQAAVDLAVAHARERRQFGQAIGSFQAIQHTLADMQTRVDLARLMLYRLAALIDAGRSCRRESAQAKMTAAETFHFVAERGMQIMASAGYSLDSDMQRYWRDSRLYLFGEGSIEIMRTLIARDMGL